MEEEKPKYVAIPDFYPDQTIKDIYSGDLHKQTYGLYSLTYYSGDYHLILSTLEKFIHNEDWNLRYTAYQCLMRFLELFRDLPIDKFLPYILKGFEDEHEDVRGNAHDCLRNIFYCITPAWNYEERKMNSIIKSGEPFDVVKVLLSIHYKGWKGDKLGSVIRKCLRHPSSGIQFCGGILLDHAYTEIHSQLSSLESATKLSQKLGSSEMKYLNNEVFIVVDWIEEDMSKLKKTIHVQKKKNERTT